MGVITTAYSIPPNLMRKIRADNDNLAFILEPEDENPNWKVEDYDFDKAIEELISFLQEFGYKKTAEKINCETYFYSDSKNYLDYDGYDIWIIPPSQVKSMFDELKNATLSELKKKGVANEMHDRRGSRIPENFYESYFMDIVNLKNFLKKVAGQGNYLLFTEA
ncbi:MAG: YfbM family protein [Pyrinomonadaceae bacterium]|nr:YfbM family protein [Pyrinomonadaceae bacterium]